MRRLHDRAGGGTAAALLLAMAFLYGSNACAEPRRIAHGRDITTADVGPRAAGLRPGVAQPGGVIRDGGANPFARLVTQGAVYDGFRVAGPHLLIEGAYLTSAIDVQTRLAVVIRGSVIRPRTKSFWAVLTRPGSGPLLMLYSEAGAATTGDPADAVDVGVDLRGSDAIVYRSHVSMAVDGVHVSASGVRIEESVIDQLAFYTGAHNDAVQMLGHAANVRLARNRILNAQPETSVVSIVGPDIAVVDNYLAGGGYTIYGGSKGDATGTGPAMRVRIEGNVLGRDYFVRSGNFGPVAYWSKDVRFGNVWLGNSYASGEAVLP